ncbi:amidase family protein [Ensifer sp.]|uniref:amidase n=1 Tax=Ensifer sp. TaxID=1872086 RepID=UPI00289B1871|nr:amidase family protein [Ensifer sp.]
MREVETGVSRQVDPFVCMDAVQQAGMVARGEISPLELVDAAIARIELVNPHVNALASIDFDRARARARATPLSGPFAGVPTLLKDLLPYPGQSAGFGTRLFKGQPAQGGSDYVNALDAAGLVVLGKSTTSEFGLIGTTETLAHGATRNPWNTDLSTGGSSGGAVAAVASGMVPIAHASDGGGSIRGPASFCGLFGYKPSRGRTVSAGLPPTMPTARLISDHCVSRSVRDSAVWLAATERPDLDRPLPTCAALGSVTAKPLRIGVFRRDSLDRAATQAADQALDRAIALCEALGHEVIACAGPQVTSKATSDAFFALTGLGLAGLFDQIHSHMGAAFDEAVFEPYTREIVRRSRSLSADDIGRSVAALTAADDAANRFIADYDVLLSPTVSFTAFPLGQYGPDSDPDALIAFTEDLAGYTVVASLAGWPAMSVPLHWSADDLPIGCHFAAAPGRDALLFSLAFQLEEMAPWAKHLDRLAERLACRNG